MFKTGAAKDEKADSNYKQHMKDTKEWLVLKIAYNSRYGGLKWIRWQREK